MLYRHSARFAPLQRDTDFQNAIPEDGLRGIHIDAVGQRDATGEGAVVELRTPTTSVVSALILPLPAYSQVSTLYFDLQVRLVHARHIYTHANLVVPFAYFDAGVPGEPGHDVR
jgi:hypothetical protein